MNIEKKNLNRAWELLNELKKLEDVSNVCRNYDVKKYAVFSTLHNNNTNQYKEVKIPMPPDICKTMSEYISNRIDEIKKELESL